MPQIKPTDDELDWALTKLQRFESWEGYPKTDKAKEFFAAQLLQIVHPIAAFTDEMSTEKPIEYPAVGLEEATEWLLMQIGSRYTRLPRPIVFRQIWCTEGRGNGMGWTAADGQNDLQLGWGDRA